MKNYTITVNGNVYDVTVEENEQAQQLLRQHLLRHRKQHQPKHRQNRQQLQALEVLK